jgi:1-acyl-sn-glycerol-3-phosphate acyltransferase
MLILASPHISKLDGFVVSRYLAKHRRVETIFAVDPDYALSPLYSKFLNIYGNRHKHFMVPLDSRKPMALRTLLKDLQVLTHLDVVLFPQGTGITDTERTWKAGAYWLAKKSGCDVMTLYLDHDGLIPSVATNRWSRNNCWLSMHDRWAV